MQQIHWFPGHMKKAQNDIQDKIKIVDLVIELLDARIPLSSRNPKLYKLSENKNRLVVLTKNDLADPAITNKWIEYFKSSGFEAIFADLNKDNEIKKIIKQAEKLGENKNTKLVAKGMKPQPIRAMIIGIPNVGKSTLINKLAKRNAASVQNKPGHTKSQQWIKVSDKFELLDTPGILPSNYDDKKTALNLALVGSINDVILPIEEIASYALEYLKSNYPNNLKKRFEYLDLNLSSEETFALIAKRRGYFVKDGLDLYKTQKVFLNELKNGILGQISFETI